MRLSWGCVFNASEYNFCFKLGGCSGGDGGNAFCGHSLFMVTRNASRQDDEMMIRLFAGQGVSSGQDHRMRIGPDLNERMGCRADPYPSKIQSKNFRKQFNPVRLGLITRKRLSDIQNLFVGFLSEEAGKMVQHIGPSDFSGILKTGFLFSFYQFIEIAFFAVANFICKGSLHLPLAKCPRDGPTGATAVLSAVNTINGGLECGRADT